MRTAPTLFLVASLAAMTGLTSCGTTEAPASATASSPAGAAAPATAAPATNAEGDVTNPLHARKSSHLTKAAAKIQNGVTTRKDIIGKLGLFYSKGTNAAGQPTGTWTFKPSETTGKAWIPGSAFIPGAVITYYQSVTAVFDANDVVVSHSFLETTKEKTGLGFSYGS